MKTQNAVLGLQETKNFIAIIGDDSKATEPSKTMFNLISRNEAQYQESKIPFHSNSQNK